MIRNCTRPDPWTVARLPPGIRRRQGAAVVPGDRDDGAGVVDADGAQCLRQPSQAPAGYQAWYLAAHGCQEVKVGHVSGDQYSGAWTQVGSLAPAVPGRSQQQPAGAVAQRPEQRPPGRPSDARTYE